MCFIKWFVTREAMKEFAKGEILEKDKKVYKVLVETGGKLSSPYYPTPWKVGETKTEEYIEPMMVSNADIHSLSIDAGLHACTTLQFALSVSEDTYGDIYEMIIPKGSRVWEDGGEIVTTSITFVNQESIATFTGESEILQEFDIEGDFHNPW